MTYFYFEDCSGWKDDKSDCSSPAGISLIYNCGDGCCFDDPFVCFDCYVRLRWKQWPSYQLARFAIRLRSV